MIYKKLHISLVFSILVLIKQLKHITDMHNLKTIFDKIFDICKQFSSDLVNSCGNIPRRGVVPKFSDLEVIALSFTSEALSIDSENYLFNKLEAEYQHDFPNLICRRQYNDRRKILFDLKDRIRRRIADAIDGGETYYCIDSMPVVVCKYARSNRCKLGKDNYETAPSFGYCASQNMHYYGYKLHSVCSLNGVIHTFDLTKASVHDIKYLQDIKQKMCDITLLGDKGYLSKDIQLDLFETVHIQLEVPYRMNQKDYKPTFKAFAKARKRIETVFSQLDDQFMMIRNYAKQQRGLFTRVLAKIGAMTIMQYINKENNKPIGRVKYAFD